jgi:hypothetical protein
MAFTYVKTMCLRLYVCLLLIVYMVGCLIVWFRAQLKLHSKRIMASLIQGLIIVSLKLAKVSPNTF